MTVLQFLSATLNLSKFPDISIAPQESQAEIISALNVAVQTYQAYAPDVLKRTTVNVSIGAPRSLTGLSIAAGSTSNTGTPFLAADRGKTVKIGDVYNEIVSTTTLLMPNTGSSTVTTGTVYDDTVAFFDDTVERTVNNPRCIRNNESWTLARVEGDHMRQLFGWHLSTPFLRAIGSTGFDRVTADRPEVYGVLPVGQSVASGSLDAAFMLRVDPLPLAGCIMEVSIDQRPATYTTAAIWDGTVLPMPAGHVYAYLIPLFRAELVGTTAWGGDKIQTDVALRNKADAIYLIQRLPNSFAPTSVVIGTAMGY